MALAYARGFPDRVQRLVLESLRLPFMGLSERHKRIARKGALPDPLGEIEDLRRRLARPTRQREHRRT